MPKARWLALLFALFACARAQTLPSSHPSRLLSQALPQFGRPTVQGPRFDGRSQGGRVVVVKFIAAYCEPCKKTLPAIEALHRQYPDVVVVGVSEDEHADEALGLVQRYGLTFPVVHDTGNVLAGRFRVGVLPMTFVGDRKGRVAWVGGPEHGEDELRQAVTTVLSW
jgi:thiol-disulfide isomerase/thioredoxin